MHYEFQFEIFRIDIVRNNMDFFIDLLHGILIKYTLNYLKTCQI